MATPMSAGDLTTRIPAASMAFIFSAAVPLPRRWIAPAWPIRRPGGAVWPAMKPTTGFLTWAFAYSPPPPPRCPDLADHHDRLGRRRSSLKRRSASVWVVPMIGSPPMPMQVVWPMPSALSWATAS